MKTLVVMLLIGSLTFSSDEPPQCDQPVFARNNPGLCSPTGFPFPDIPSGGGQPHEGLLGGLLHHLGVL